jgi:hypothetical protein
MKHNGTTIHAHLGAVGFAVRVEPVQRVGEASVPWCVACCGPHVDGAHAPEAVREAPRLS